MRELYPSIKPFNSFKLRVSKLHEIYVEEVGNPKGLPILFVHGGPGGGIEEKHRRYFNPNKWRIILFDQRGCGKSTPFGELNENTTFDLIDDIETIRKHLEIENWHIFGGSWGSTLALSYAICHSKKVLGLILRGIFLVRKKEINWFYQEGASNFFPDEWEKFLAPIPKEEHSDLLLAYYKRLTGTNKEELAKAAKAWSTWEGATSKLKQDKKLISSFSDSNFAYAFSRIESHYFFHNAFFDEDNWILNNAHKLAETPGVIVQGRYDMPCPPISAFDLAKAWPKAKMIIIEDAGHSISEPGILDALINTTDNMS